MIVGLYDTTLMQKWNSIPTQKVVAQTQESLEKNGFIVKHVATKAEALTELVSLLPEGSEVMTGSSTTLTEIGFTEKLEKNTKNWKNVQATVWSENDPDKRNKLRRQAVASQFLVASANALTQDGMVVAVDATGSRVSGYPFAAENVLLVVGANKITEDVADAMARVRQHVFPLENKRAESAYGFGSTIAKWVILEKETTPGRTTIILVDEVLGF